MWKLVTKWYSGSDWTRFYDSKEAAYAARDTCADHDQCMSAYVQHAGSRHPVGRYSGHKWKW